MLPGTELQRARAALQNRQWEMRYNALSLLCSIGEPADIPRVEACLQDAAAPVKVMALKALGNLLAFESEAAIKQCLFYNNPEDAYGSLEVRNTARLALDTIMEHTRPSVEMPLAGNA